MKNKDKRPSDRIRSNRRSHKTPVSKAVFTPKRLSFLAVSVALSLGVGYQAIAANEATPPKPSVSPFSASSLGSTGATASNTGGSNGVASTNTGGSTNATPTNGAQGPTTAGLMPSASNDIGSGSAANAPSVIPFDPSESVLNNAQSCAEDMKVIREEALIRDIELADAGFDVDVFFKDMRESGCLVSIQDSISLANQITSLSGGSIASMIMSQVQSKILEAGEQMMQKIFAKGCEVMLEASQNVYGPINDVVKKYGVYANPDMVGNTVGGLIDGTIDEAMFNFDNKLDDIANKITQKNQQNNTGGGSGSGGGGPLVPPPTGGMGNSTGNQNISDAEKAAAQKTVEDLAASRNNLVYPYHETRRNVYKTDPRTGNKYLESYFIDISLNTLNKNNPKGITVNSIQNGSIQNDPNAVCVYVAQITSINNEIRRLVNEKGVENTSNLPVKPLNISPGYWSQANGYIRSINSNGSDCATPNVNVTSPPADGSGMGGTIGDGEAVAPFFGDSPPTNYGRSAPAPQSSNAINYSATPNATTPPVTTSPTTNAATEYMEQRQSNSSEGSAAAPAEKPTSSSNPFNRMRNIFN